MIHNIHLLIILYFFSGQALNDRASSPSTIDDKFTDSSTTLSRYQTSFQTTQQQPKYSKDTSSDELPMTHYIQQNETPPANYIKQKREPIQQNPWINPAAQNLISSSSREKRKTRPEDDILYQWRLARKMEMAAQAVEKHNPFVQRVSYNLSKEKRSSKFNNCDREEIEEEKYISKLKRIEDSKDLGEQQDCSCNKGNNSKRRIEESKQIKTKDLSDEEISTCHFHKEFLKNNRHLKCCQQEDYREEQKSSREENRELKLSTVQQVSTGIQVELHHLADDLKISKVSTGVQCDQPVKLNKKERKIQSRAAPVINDVRIICLLKTWAFNLL